jgi:aminoglycoside 2''-phosphotransferase
MDNPVKRLYLDIIKKHFPNISQDNIRSLPGGNDHDVFVVNEEKVFRFPKVSREINPRRANFLKQFAPLSPLPLPLIEIHHEDGFDYEVNSFLYGISFYPSIAKTFSHLELMQIAKKMGEFLTAVHSFPLDKARALGIDELDPTDFWEYMEQNPNAFPKFQKSIFPHISKEEQIWIEKLFTDYISLIRHNPFQTKLTHSDMWTFHIIVDPEKHILSGVIDFWGRIADPANDFKAFEYYGDDFVKEVYKSYSLPIDEDFEKRRFFYTGHDEVFELARSIERGNEKKIEQHKKSLSNYIKTHYLMISD